MNKTLLWCALGMVSFWIGGGLRMYMVVRVKGWSGYPAKQSAVIDTYSELAKKGEAPAWPLPLSYLFMALGIAMIFGSILASNNK